MKKIFGTDGVRGRVGESPVMPAEVLHLGWAAGRVLGSGYARGRVIIGKDTRISGYLLESALEAGLCAAGIDIAMTGPLPSPGIALLTRQIGACGGIVISASHNPYHDNGIKFFSATGKKLDIDTEKSIELLMNEQLSTVAPESLGKAERLIDAVPRYAEYCRGTLPPGFRLDGLKIVLDCANGAAYQVAPLVLRELGASVSCIGVEPDGFNINRDVGSVNPGSLSQAVLDIGADIGIAFDGDADRVILVSKSGKVIDGDGILYILSNYLIKNKSNEGVVGTDMTNLGVEIALRYDNVPFVRSQVGDRHVLKELESRKWFLGGEPSGHIICLDRSTTGDGLVAALGILETIKTTGSSLDELIQDLEIFPQLMVNVPINVDRSANLMSDSSVQKVIDTAESELGLDGRLVVRMSGTEPVVRVMVESKNHERVKKLAHKIANTIETVAS